MYRCPLIAGLALVAALATAPHDARALSGVAPQVTIQDGTLVGKLDNGVRVFMGVPFAAPPTGSLRWKPPAPVQPWTGKRDATRAAPACPAPQRSGFYRPKTGGHSEDCLYLNVWAPVGASKLPVLVWIHGGANVVGDASAQLNDGAELARHGIVVVAINYRLGYLGFFATAALNKAHAPGNFGLLDQIAGLRWVKHNIAAFGGDPGRVTVGGESAGGEDILYLMTMPATRGLFTQAIVESGGGWQKTKSRVDVTRSASAALARVGIPADADLSTLRAVPAGTLVRALKVAPGFGPFIDGVTVTRAPSAAFLAGQQAPVPLLIGSNSWEANLMRHFNADSRWNKFTTRPFVRKLYGTAEDGGQTVTQRLFRDVVMAAPARWVASMQAKQAPTWLYRFGYVNTANRGKWPGAPHGGELPYVFGTLQSFLRVYHQTASRQDLDMAATVANCWAAFIKTGQPACKLGAWHRYGPADDNAMDVGIEHSGEVRHQRAQVFDALDHLLAPGHARRQ